LPSPVLPVSLTSLPGRPDGTPSNIRNPTAGNGHGVVFGKGRPSRLRLAEPRGAVGEGFRRRAITALNRRSMTYGDAEARGGYDFVRSGTVLEVFGADSRVFVALSLSFASDVSYAMVARSIWRKTMKKSKERSRNFDGGYAIPMKSRMTVLPSEAPDVAWLHTVKILTDTRSAKKARNDQAVSSSLGLEHWDCDKRRKMRVHIDGEMKKARTCN